MQSIAILLTVHNRKLKTLACLAHVFAQHEVSGCQWEVFMTDDGCTDGTPEAVAAQFPSVHIVKGDGNLYWNRGMYAVWQTASEYKDFDFYLWLNDDTLLFVNALKVLLQSSLLKQSLSIMVGATVASTDHSQVTYGGRSENGLLLPKVEQMQLCRYFNGNIVLIPRAVYKQLGKNDPVFHHALGDFDYGLRASKVGITSFVVPGVLGVCDLHEHLPSWCNAEKKLGQRWKVFRSPLGQNPEEFFIYERRHSGLGRAVFHYMTNHLRVLFPGLWKQ
ncbi:MAG: glycosyltransferase [Chitinophagaceae bacterium]